MTSEEGDGAPIRLSALGATELRKAGAGLTRVLAQPRRFALLVHVALGAPERFVRRDHLVGMFWAESDEARARASLRQALSYLRRGLGEGVLVARGDGEVGVAADRFSSDVADFHDRLDRGDDEGALSLYRGPLLPGFLVAGAPEFERWLAGQRRALRAAAVDAATRLSAAAEEASHVERAEAMMRRALQVDPVNETAARRRMSLLARMGNRAGALAAYDELADRLRHGLDIAPSPDTEALAARIRAAGGAPSPVREPERTRVLVVRFENRTGRDDLDPLGGMAADWISQGLAALPDVVVTPPLLAAGGRPTGAVSPDAAVSRDAASPGPPSPPSPAAASPTGGAPPSGGGADAADVSRARTLVKETGAGTLIEGALYLDEGRLRVRTRIIDTVARRLIPAPDDVVVPEGRAMDALPELGRRVNAALAPVLSPRAVHVRGGARPPSFEAFRAYMEGLELFIRGRWEPALEHFRSAAEAEPEYALPRIVSAIALWNLGRLEEAEGVAREAAALRHRLGRFEAAVLDGVRAWLAGDWLGAHEAARVQAGIAPGSIPHFQVAEEARRLNRPREALSVLSRLDPERGELAGWIFYWIELANAHHLLGDHAGELEAVRRARMAHPDDPVAMLLELRALASVGRVEGIAEVLDRAGALPGGREPSVGSLLLEAALELDAHGRPADAEPLFARAATWYEERVDDTSPEPLRRAFARSLHHAGRWDEAEALFRDLAGPGAATVAPLGFHHGHLQAHLDEGYLALLAARRGDLDEVDAWRRRLVEARGPFLYGAQWYWLAALDARLGETDRAVARLRRAMAEGLPHEMFLHADPHLRALEGHPRFDALMRPRG